MEMGFLTPNFFFSISAPFFIFLFYSFLFYSFLFFPILLSSLVRIFFSHSVFPFCSFLLCTFLFCSCHFLHSLSLQICLLPQICISLLHPSQSHPLVVCRDRDGVSLKRKRILLESSHATCNYSGTSLDVFFFCRALDSSQLSYWASHSLSLAA